MKSSNNEIKVIILSWLEPVIDNQELTEFQQALGKSTDHSSHSLLMLKFE